MASLASQYCVALVLASMARATVPGGKFLQKSHERHHFEHGQSAPVPAPGATEAFWPPLVISLKQQNVSKLLDAALNVSTPGHKDYGNYWSVSDIGQFTAPRAEDVQVVTSWLTSINATFSVEYELVSVTSNAEVAEQTIPPNVRAATTAIYSLKSDTKLRPSPDKFTDGNSITPFLVSETYSTHSAIVNRSGPNSQIAFSGASFIATKSLTKFFAEVPQSTLHRAGDADLFSYTTDGASRAAPQDLNCENDNPSEWCTGYGEPTFDVEWMMGTAPGVRTHLFRLNVPVDPPTEYILPVCPALLAFVNYLLKYPDAPYTASISYGLPKLCSDKQIEDMEIRFAKLALKGVSLMAASGDAGTYPADGCDTSACTLQTVWPAASPWITAVGGTKLLYGAGVAGQEVWSGSGGGFSEYSSRKIAPWQEAAVSEYLAKLSSLPGAPPKSTFDAAGVGVPDVASFATEMTSCSPTACPSGGEGTSYASPTFAGIVSLLNEARLQANLPRMGFLNPFLYKHADAFIDITNGINNGSDALYGFPAALGWDAATGLGTPNFEKLRAAAMRSFPNATNKNY